MKPLELNSADYRIKSASIGHGRDGEVFRCTLTPVTDEVLEALDAAAHSKRMIRLIFPNHTLGLECIEAVRTEPGCVRIAGRVVEAR